MAPYPVGIELIDALLVGLLAVAGSLVIAWRTPRHVAERIARLARA